jgi:excisionase family DNA binding protein
MNDARAFDPADTLNLKQAAAHLGVHYMTVYRYVRQGRLDAEKVGTEWRVHGDAVNRFRQPQEAPVVRGEGVDWTARLVDCLVNADESAAWMVIDRALAAGHDPSSCALDMIGGAIARIDAQHATGGLTASHSPLATTIAHRLIARLGARFRRPGRSRGTVVLGTPIGERHGLPIAIVADLLRFEGFDVLELGAEVAPEGFADAVRRAPRLIAAGVGVTTIDNLTSARDAIAAIRSEDATVPVVVGGQAVLNPEVAKLLEADAWAADGRSAVALIQEIAGRPLRATSSH